MVVFRHCVCGLLLLLHYKLQTVYLLINTHDCVDVLQNIHGNSFWEGGLALEKVYDHLTLQFLGLRASDMRVNSAL